MLADRRRLELARDGVVEILLDCFANGGDVEPGDADLPARRPLCDELVRGLPVGLIERAADGLAAEGALDVDGAAAAPIAL